jgi:hypothetical protein
MPAAAAATFEAGPAAGPAHGSVLCPVAEGVTRRWP